MTLPIQAEVFKPRGIGKEWSLSCFVCGKSDLLLSNVSGFVNSRDAGQRIVVMFDGLARLDYREREPNWIQVKVGACATHLPALEDLNETTSQAGGVILPAMLERIKMTEWWRTEKIRRDNGEPPLDRMGRPL